eukprot:gb/GECG01013446.1/.p1 GENE.gb/GECG01013446.1/~~gb/GECG01013446.1/.p1  ORF type:complete len:329 (+),score=24.52 gb/GECG01013446.1/:1-987(+)
MSSPSETSVAPLSCEKRCLSIQSHVVFGYVGNKCAVFPLQLHGFDVSYINSVQFSNHTKYDQGIRGQVMNGEELEGLVEGLKNNSLLRFQYLLTGYIGSSSFLESVMHVVKEAKAQNPDLCYVCDPVLGDEGRLYVPKELVEIYKTRVLPVVTILTPNQFEAQLLTDMEIVDLKSAHAVCNKLHSLGVETVVITSTDLPRGQDESMLVILSTPWKYVRDDLAKYPDVKKEGKYARCHIRIPKLHAAFTGTGDLVAASILLWTHQHPNSYATALSKTMSTLQKVCQRTLATDERIKGPMSELQLIQSKDVIENPEVPEELKPIFSSEEY